MSWLEADPHSLVMHLSFSYAPSTKLSIELTSKVSVTELCDIVPSC